ncbi:MAG: NAD(P)H-dependent oxidoreductase [Lentisphaeria bacterium]|nr:NAD(P)H-dependent oxidoreductase [Lentisphaeria bacterium]
MKRVIGILGSSNPSGNTAALLRTCMHYLDGRMIDLSSYNLTGWDYHHQNADDPFREVASQLVKADIIIFATPVYWYSMSSQMKIFFDRLSDLISSHPKMEGNKGIGRSLAGKQAWLVATGADQQLPLGFEVPFEKTSEYFDINYHGVFYKSVQESQSYTPEEDRALRHFLSSIQEYLPTQT